MGTALLQELDHISAAIASSAYEAIDAMYGPNGTHPKPYHNKSHAIDVAAAAEAMAIQAVEHGRIVPESRFLLRIAGAFHDFDHSLGSVASEQASADAAIRAMRLHALFNDDHCAMVREAIMATVVANVDGVTKQSAHGKSIEAQILADADLATLGSPTDYFWSRVRNLYSEYYPGQSPQGATWHEFNTRQLHFLQNHSYYTAEAQRLFPHKIDNIASVKLALSSDTIPS